MYRIIFFINIAATSLYRLFEIFFSGVPKSSMLTIIIEKLLFSPFFSLLYKTFSSGFGLTPSRSFYRLLLRCLTIDKVYIDGSYELLLRRLID